jgi:hypothetical protein
MATCNSEPKAKPGKAVTSSERPHNRAGLSAFVYVNVTGLHMVT